jgi:hypothetical protein
MTTNKDLILAGSAGSSGGASLAWFAPPGTQAPVGTMGTPGSQSVALTGTPAGGTFTLSYSGATTAPIAFNATAAAVQTALAALPGLADVTVTGGPGPTTAWVVAFDALDKPGTLTGNAALLTGGTTPTVAVTVTTPEVQTLSGALIVPTAPWQDAGWVSDTGLAKKINESSKQEFAYGSGASVKTLVSQRSIEFGLTFLESNLVSLPISHRLPLGGVTVDGSGTLTIAEGGIQLPTYAALFDIVDNGNHVRVFCPAVAATSVTGWTAAPASLLDYPVSLTAYPDATGHSVYTTMVLPSLAS